MCELVARCISSTQMQDRHETRHRLLSQRQCCDCEICSYCQIRPNRLRARAFCEKKRFRWLSLLVSFVASSSSSTSPSFPFSGRMLNKIRGNGLDQVYRIVFGLKLVQLRCRRAKITTVPSHTDFVRGLACTSSLESTSIAKIKKKNTTSSPQTTVRDWTSYIRSSVSDFENKTYQAYLMMPRLIGLHLF